MQPTFVAPILLLIVGLVLLAFSHYKAGKPGGPTVIASRVRQRTGAIFLVIGAVLLAMNLLR